MIAKIMEQRFDRTAGKWKITCQCPTCETIFRLKHASLSTMLAWVCDVDNGVECPVCQGMEAELAEANNLTQD